MIMKKRAILIIMMIMLMTLMLFVLPANADETITKTLDIASLNKNSTGAGYTWTNIDGILTMDGLRIETEDDYGLTLPSNATIVLKGNNYIKASDCAIRAVSGLAIEGTGTLTIISGNTGIACASNSELDALRFRSGSISITAEGNAVFSEYATVYFSGAKATISGKTHAVRAKNIQITSGKLDFAGRLSAVSNLSIKGANVTASSQAPVLSAGVKLELSSVDIFCGNSLDALSEVTEYNGSSAIKLNSNIKNSKKGLLFGGRFPVFVDYIVFVALGLVAIAIIAVPIYIKSKKTKKLLAEHEKMLQANKKKRK